MADERSDLVRTWGPVLLVLVGLPLAAVALRAVLPPIGPKTRPPAPVEAPAPAPAPPPPAAGSAECARCHEAEAEAWRPSSHALAERDLGPEDPREIRAVGPDGEEQDWPLVRAIGVDPVVQYLVAFPGGRLQVTETARDPRDGSWFDVFADGRAPGEWGHWTGAAMTWNARCGECHTTGFQKGWSAESASYASSFAETGVGCEACHGDADAHAAGGPAPETAAGGDTCLSCHARRADLTGAFPPGEAFLDHFAPSLVDRTDTFWPDGQVRDEDFEAAAFESSVMASKGVTCTSCHDPHSGKTRAEGDALCLSCHAAMPGFEAHDHHPEGRSPGCVGCHMPTTTYMQRDARHDHGFRVPDPALQRDRGVPSACDRCHHDRGVAWQAAAAERWWGDGGARHARADLLARAHASDEGSVPGVLAILGSDPLPGFRAAAAAHLEPWLERDEVREGLVAALADPDGLVRFAAASALTAASPEPTVHAALDRATRDPLRAVRVSAVRALRAELAPTDPRAKEYAAYLELASDDPSALTERGTWAIERGDPAGGLDDLRHARDLDPGSAPIRDALAIALSAAGQAEPAAEELRQAVRLRPDDAELWYRLGLAEVGAGHPDAAEPALARSVSLDPGLARAWYDLGLLRQRLGHGEEAIDALRAGVERAPDDVEVRYGLASVLYQQGRAADARAEAERILAIDPTNASARAILASPVR